MARVQVIKSSFRYVNEEGDFSMTADECFETKDYSYFTGLYDQYGNKIHTQVTKEPIGFYLGK